jgi:hypothetical protein
VLYGREHAAPATRSSGSENPHMSALP